MTFHILGTKNYRQGVSAMGTTRAIAADSMSAILRLLTPTNRLVCLVALATGLRITDVLSIRTEQLKRDRFTVSESKTGKNKTVRIPKELRNKVRAQAGKVYAFPHRCDGYKHRSRTTIWKDLNRVARAFRLKGLAPHSLRKSYARTLRAEGLTLSQIQRAMNHSSPTVTKLYAMADELSLR